ncbi:MAG: glycosyltransferase family 4 protein [Gammaproteobacteria bacterium]
MKLLFVDSSRYGWGTEQHFVEMVTELHRAGHDLRVVVRRNSGVDLLLEQRGIPRHSTPFRGGGDPRGLWKVIQVVRHFRPDWIVTSRAKLYWPVVIIGLWLGVRVALFRHLAYFKHWHERKLLPRLADRFYVVSEFGRDVLAAEGTPPERLIPLYNPIDVMRFVPLAPEERARRRAALGFKPCDVLAGFAGRMEQSKGLIPLREALALAMGRLAELRMVWIGDGRERAATESFVRDSGQRSRHRFVGWQTEIEKFLPLLDFLVVPSIAPETFGRVAAEAQACGVPVIVSAAGGLAEALLPGQTGQLLDSAVDCTSVCTAIESFVRDPILRARLGSAGIDFVRSRFGAEQIAAAFIRSLRSAPLALPAWEPSSASVSQRVTEHLPVHPVVARSASLSN